MLQPKLNKYIYKMEKLLGKIYYDPKEGFMGINNLYRKAKKKDKFLPGKFVVHPHHGAAKVIRRVNKNVSIFILFRTST